MTTITAATIRRVGVITIDDVREDWRRRPLRGRNGSGLDSGSSSHEMSRPSFGSTSDSAEVWPFTRSFSVRASGESIFSRISSISSSYRFLGTAASPIPINRYAAALTMLFTPRQPVKNRDPLIRRGPEQYRRGRSSVTYALAGGTLARPGCEFGLRSESPRSKSQAI